MQDKANQFMNKFENADRELKTKKKLLEQVEQQKQEIIDKRKEEIAQLKHEFSCELAQQEMYYEEFLSRVRHMQDEFSRLRKENEIYEVKQKTHESKLEKIKETKIELIQNTEKLQKQLAEKDEEIKKLLAEIKALKASVEPLKSAKVAVENKNTRISVDLKKRVDELKEAYQKIEKLQRQLGNTPSPQPDIETQMEQEDVMADGNYENIPEDVIEQNNDDGYEAEGEEDKVVSNKQSQDNLDRVKTPKPEMQSTATQTDKQEVEVIEKIVEKVVIKEVAPSKNVLAKETVNTAQVKSNDNKTQNPQEKIVNEDAPEKNEELKTIKQVDSKTPDIDLGNPFVISKKDIVKRGESQISEVQEKKNKDEKAESKSSKGRSKALVEKEIPINISEKEIIPTQEISNPPIQPAQEMSKNPESPSTIPITPYSTHAPPLIIRQGVSASTQTHLTTSTTGTSTDPYLFQNTKISPKVRPLFRDESAETYQPGDYLPPTDRSAYESENPKYPRASMNHDYITNSPILSKNSVHHMSNNSTVIPSSIRNELEAHRYMNDPSPTLAHDNTASIGKPIFGNLSRVHRRGSEYT